MLYKNLKIQTRSRSEGKFSNALIKFYTLVNLFWNLKFWNYQPQIYSLNSKYTLFSFISVSSEEEDVVKPRFHRYFTGRPPLPPRNTHPVFMQKVLLL